ncbi:MAG TPA: hypothetical protein VGD94_08655 [Vicinamibacterales bacterium]
MILVDTSMWIDHFRSTLPALVRLLEDGEVILTGWNDRQDDGVLPSGTSTAPEPRTCQSTLICR